MHLSSLDNMKKFVADHLDSKKNESLVVFDLGSQAIGGSYRSLFECENWNYIGVDVCSGSNVDLILDDPYRWGEIKSNTVDVLVSGQTFEHIEYFWLTMQEISRVLKPEGLCCIIAPSGGPEHRYPVDCWRFYPDGLRALARYVGLEVLSARTQWESRGYPDDSDTWADSVLIARKSEINLPIKIQNTIDREPKVHLYEGKEHPEDGTSLARLATLVTPCSRVLELGPATGYFTKFLKNSLGCTVDCVEISPEMAELTSPYCDSMLVADLDCICLEDYFSFEAFDFIIAADVLEHLLNPEKILKSCQKLLKPSGRLLLSVPNIAHAAVIGGLLRGQFNYTDEGLLDRTHRTFFTRKSLLNALEKARLHVDLFDVITKLPEETEIADDYLDLPSDLQNALNHRPDALTFQFVVAASPVDLVVSPVMACGETDVDDFSYRRKDFIQGLKDRINTLEQALTNAESIMIEYRDYREKTTSRIIELQNGLAQAEKLAFTRLADLSILDNALGECQQLVKARELDNHQLMSECLQARNELESLKEIKLIRWALKLLKNKRK